MLCFTVRKWETRDKLTYPQRQESHQLCKRTVNLEIVNDQIKDASMCHLFEHNMTRGTTCTNTEHATMRWTTSVEGDSRRIFLCAVGKWCQPTPTPDLAAEEQMGCRDSYQSPAWPLRRTTHAAINAHCLQYVCCTLEEVLLRSKRVSKILHLGQEFSRLLTTPTTN